MSSGIEVQVRRPWFARLSVVCWLLSLALPAFPAGDRGVLGIEVALHVINPFAYLFAPLLALSGWANVIYLVQVVRVARFGVPGAKAPSSAWVVAALLMAVFGFSLSGTSRVVPDLGGAPSVYFWLAALVLLLVSVGFNEGAGKGRHARSAEPPA